MFISFIVFDGVVEFAVRAGFKDKKSMKEFLKTKDLSIPSSFMVSSKYVLEDEVNFVMNVDDANKVKEIINSRRRNGNKAS